MGWYSFYSDGGLQGAYYVYGDGHSVELSPLAVHELHYTPLVELVFFTRGGVPRRKVYEIHNNAALIQPALRVEDALSGQINLDWSSSIDAAGASYKLLRKNEEFNYYQWIDSPEGGAPYGDSDLLN